LHRRYRGQLLRDYPERGMVCDRQSGNAPRAATARPPTESDNHRSSRREAGLVFLAKYGRYALPDDIAEKHSDASQSKRGKRSSRFYPNAIVFKPLNSSLKHIYSLRVAIILL
jgi:hypothetical protein